MICNRRVCAIVTARTASSRFPDKVLADLGGKPVLALMIERIGRSSLVDEIVIATSGSKGDKRIVELAVKEKVKCFAGSENDVLSRILGASEKFKADIIVYLTGDCPLIDPNIIDDALRLFINSRADFVCNYLPRRAFPNGVDVEVFNLENLKKLDKQLKDPWDREHLTGGFTDNPEYKCVGLSAGKDCARPDIRITLDEQDDLHRLRCIVNYFKKSKKSVFLTKDIINFLDKNPNLKNKKAAYEPFFTAAVIGLGKVGSLYDLKPSDEIWSHAGAFNKFGRIRLVSGVDPDKKKRELFVGRWGVKQVYRSAKELFSKVRPDIVAIATPDEFHFPVLKLAVKAGVKAIICEKPISRDLKEAEEMVFLCRKNNVVLSVNHWHRWSALFKNLRKFVIDDKGIGDIQHVLYWYTKGIFNSGSHVIDILRWFFGDIAWIKANNVVDIGRPDPNIDGFIMFKSGLPCTLATVDWRKFIMADFDIIGTTGRVVLDNSGFLHYYRKNESNRFPGESEIVEANFPYEALNSSTMVEAVKNIYNVLAYPGGAVACTGEDGLNSVHVINAFLKSCGKPIKISSG